MHGGFFDNLPSGLRQHRWHLVLLQRPQRQYIEGNLANEGVREAYDGLHHCLFGQACAMCRERLGVSFVGSG